VSDERVRLFVALTLPAAVRSALGQWRDGVLRSVAGLRPVASDALHVTLCFLGSRPVGDIDAIAVACASVAGRFDATPLRVGETAWLPARRPRVLGVALEDASGSLGRVQAELSRVLADGGWYAPEERPFFPHVTVARVRKETRLRAEAVAPAPRLEFAGTELVLMRSRVASTGARYEALAHAVLGSGGPDPLARGALGSAGSEPLAVVRAFHQDQAVAYAGGSLEPLRALLCDDVVWHVPGRSAIAGEHRGIEAVLAYLERRRAMADATFRVHVHGMALIAERVVQLAGGVAERDGRPLSWETVGVFRVREGRIAECWLVPFDQLAFDEIWR
jgi:2'-5' RNA ligase